MIRKIFFSIILMIISTNIFAQEFNCTVQVSSKQVQGTDRRIYQTIQNAIYDFINNRKWTNYSYKIEERIECNILVTISSRSSSRFKAKLNLMLRRPIFNTSYNSVLFNFVDKDFNFDYIEYQPLEYADNTYTSNLTSVLAYYAYIFLGLDADSFSPLGGTPYYEKAQAIVNAAQNSDENGWKAYENTKNRYWLVENLLNNNYKPIRDCIYQYHRKGLDIMNDKLEVGRASILHSLTLLQRVHNNKPNLFLLHLFMDAKSDELVNIFSKAPVQDKRKAVNILKELDPANSSKYQKILTGK